MYYDYRERNYQALRTKISTFCAHAHARQFWSSLQRGKEIIRESRKLKKIEFGGGYIIISVYINKKWYISKIHILSNR
jgi:hypothetical protein